MKKARWVTAAAGTAVLAAGFTLPATAAYAGGGGNGGSSSNGNGGLLSVLSGNTVNAPVSAPVNVCGIAVSLLGGATASCAGGASSSTTISGPGSGGHNGNAGVASVGSGNTVNAPVSVPVNVCGVSAAVAGAAKSGCKGGSSSHTTVNSPGSGGSSNGNAGILSAGSGNTVNAPVSVPVNVCGIAVAIIGAANSGCQGGATSTTSIDEPTSGGHNGNGGIASIGSGNTINAPISAPVNVCGISLALIGLADSGCCGGSSSTSSVNQSPSGSTPSSQPSSGSSTPPGNGGTQSGAGAATTTVAAESLPITGANIAGMLVAAFGSLGLGGASLATARRRRHSEAA